MTTQKKDAFVVRFFKDAGTEEEFQAGTIVPLEPGRFHNFKVAGLVREASPSDVKASQPKAA
ncbi:hypothetical protein GG804_26105 [Sphingomonas histidinilytica]|uniref:hypothetical protein n=1 Tax=Rhizorhabdus histidinilytica TaxID=439228 RepID=UPI000F790E2D|nr:hypothetical protein [Rhizorhabdus histidinilytica]MBO9380243.1 hypothetical protein [Rhizorhabdus histidinilytica]QEH81189.1 hypothetical protein EIK56_25135 [Sphingomonas sp. C8-2]